MDERSCYILLVLLEQNDYITFQQIVNLIEVKYNYTCNVKSIGASIRTINTFFELIFKIEDAIEVIKKKGTKFRVPVLNEGELRFLFDALTTNSSIPSESGYLLYDKLTKLIPVHSKEIIEIKEQTKMNLVYLNTILQAIHNQKSIRFKYINYYYQDGKLVEQNSPFGNDLDSEYYIVSPYKIQMVGGKYYLACYYSKHEGVMSIFRLDRMRSVMTFKKSYYVDKSIEWDIDMLMNQAVNMYAGNHEITLKLYCHKRTLRQVVDEFQDKISNVLLSNDPNYLNITIENISESDGLLGWVMMMSPQIKVTSPESLITKIKNKLEESLEIYQDK